MSQFKFQTFFLFFLLTLTIVGCGGDQSSTTTQNDEDEQEVENGSQQNDDTNNSDEETETDNQTSEPITETVSFTLSNDGPKAYFPGALPELSYQAYSFEGEENQIVEVTIQLNHDYSEGSPFGMMGIFITDSFEELLDATSYDDMTNIVKDIADPIYYLPMPPEANFSVTLSESNSYTLFIAVAPGFGGFPDELDYTLTWTIE